MRNWLFWVIIALIHACSSAYIDEQDYLEPIFYDFPPIIENENDFANILSSLHIPSNDGSYKRAQKYLLEYLDIPMLKEEYYFQVMSWFLNDCKESNLTALDLSGTNLRYSEYAAMIVFFEKDNFIEALNIRRVYISEENVMILRELLEIVNLKRLNLSECSLSIISFSSILPSIKKYKQLKTLNLDGNSLGNEALFLIANAEFLNLRELSLAENLLTNDGFPHLAQILQSNNNLKKLNLSANGFHVGFLTKLNDLFPYIPDIRVLNFEGIPMKEREFCSFLLIVARMQNLKELYMKGHELNLLCTNTLVDVLQHNSNISNLSVTVEKSGEEELKRIKSLKYIDFDYCNVFKRTSLFERIKCWLSFQ